MTTQKTGHFLSCDWGSSSFRLRLVSTASGEVEAERRADCGCSVVAATEPSVEQREQAFESAFEQQLKHFLGDSPDPAIPVVLSGMVTSAHGWHELPYGRVPAGLDGAGLSTATYRLRDGRQATFVSGLRDISDVMRGEECELLGLGATAGDREVALPDQALVVMPGTHCKHVTIRNRIITGFRTFITGELYALLRHASVLRHSFAAEDEQPAALDRAVLAEGARGVADNGLAAMLFQVRVGTLLRGSSAATSEAFLNGILVGAEFCGTGPTKDDIVVLLAASERLQAIYQTVATTLGFADRFLVLPPAQVADLAVKGHRTILSRLDGRGDD